MLGEGPKPYFYKAGALMANRQQVASNNAPKVPRRHVNLDLKTKPPKKRVQEPPRTRTN